MKNTIFAVALLTASGSALADNRITHIPSAGAATDTLEWSVVRQRAFRGTLIETADAELYRLQGVPTKSHADDSWIEWHTPDGSWVAEGGLVVRLNVSTAQAARASDLILTLLGIEPPTTVTINRNVEQEKGISEERGFEGSISFNTKNGGEVGVRNSATTVVNARYRTAEGTLVERRVAPEEVWALYRELEGITAERLNVEYRAAFEGYVRFAADVLERNGRLLSGEPLFAIETPRVEARLFLDAAAYRRVRPRRFGVEAATIATITKDGVAHDGIVTRVARNLIQVPLADTSAEHEESLVPYVEVTIEAARSLGDSLKYLEATTGMMAAVSLYHPAPALSVPVDAVRSAAGRSRVIVAQAEQDQWVARSVPVRVRDVDDVITHGGVDFVAVVDGLAGGEIVLRGETFADGDIVGDIGRIFVVRDCRTCPVMTMIPAGEVGRSGQPAGAGHLLVGYRPVHWDSWERCAGGKGVCRLPRWLFRPSEVADMFPPRFGEATLTNVWKFTFGPFGFQCRNPDWQEFNRKRGWRNASLFCRSPIWKWVESEGYNWRDRPGFWIDGGPDRRPKTGGFKVRYLRYSCYFEGGCGDTADTAIAVPEGDADRKLQAWVLSGVDRHQWVQEDFLGWLRGKGHEYRLLTDDRGRLWSYARRCRVRRASDTLYCGEGLSRRDVVEIPFWGSNQVLGYWIAREP